MKVVQINTVYGCKSTGRTCMELEKYLTAHGHTCLTAFGWGAKSGGNTYRINTKAEYYFHNLMSRLTGLEGYFSVFATWRLIRFLKKYKPDLIHLRNLHGHYVNLPLLFRYLEKSKLPVVVHLHDFWIVSGCCPHPTLHKCDGWLGECNHCPSKKSYPQSLFFDFSRKMFEDKKKWFYALDNVHVVGVSEWVKQEGDKSFLNKFPVSRIYNWINTDVFRPVDSTILETYSLDSHKFNIICVGAGWESKGERYRDLLALADKLDDDMQLIVVGAASAPATKDNVRHIGFTNSTEQLAQLYSACDVYVHFSVADTFGKVIAEAMACGLPAIVYDRTACPEIVGEGCGFSVAAHDIDALYEKIKAVKVAGKESYSSACIEWVRHSFGYEANCAQTLALYEEMLAQADVLSAV